MSVDDFVSLSKTAIGEGAFSEVYKVRQKSTEYFFLSQIYAIKVISKALVLQKQLVQQLEREVRILYELEHPYIIKIFTHFEDDRNVYVVMEFAAGGHMFKMLRKLKEFDERRAAQYMRELVSALQYLHSRDPPIIHRDIKPENILLDSEGRSKLADFGWSNYSVEDASRDTYCGTLDYLAPEMVNRSGHTVKLDIWSLGVLLYEMLAGRAPFEAKRKEDLFENIRKLKLKFPMTFPPLAKDLVRKLLKINPLERITLEELLNHQWMRSIQPLRTLMQAPSLDAQIPSEPQASLVVRPQLRPGSGISSPRSTTRIKIMLPDPTVQNPQYQEKVRHLKAVQDRYNEKLEEMKRIQEVNQQIKSQLADVNKKYEESKRSGSHIQEKITSQSVRLKSLSDHYSRYQAKHTALVRENKEIACNLSRIQLERFAYLAQITAMQHTTRAMEVRAVDASGQVTILRNLKSVKRSASLPKMGDMISAVCDFNRKLRSKPRTQSASRKDRGATSPKSPSPMLTPRRMKQIISLPPSAGSTPRRIPRHKANV